MGHLLRSARRTRFASLATLPVLVGAVAVPLAGAGTVSSSPSSTGRATTSYQAVSSPAATTALLDRGLAISRDSERQALGQSSSSSLVAAGAGVARQRNAELAEFANEVQKQANQTPVASWSIPVQEYRITATFGQGSNLWSNRHTGLDFAAPTGTLVGSVTNGTVVQAGVAGAYGNRVVIRSDEGIETQYSHLSAFAVKAGDKVTSGQTIGKVGSTGNSTGPHLHLEVRPGGGDPVDPAKALQARGVQP